MMKSFTLATCTALVLLHGFALSSPTLVNRGTRTVRDPAPAPASDVDIPGPLQSSLTAAVAAIEASGISGDQVVAAYESAVAKLTAEAQEKYQDVLTLMSSAFASAAVASKRQDTDEARWDKRQTTGIDSYNNVNSKQPSSTIYPRKSSADVAYSVSEATLRAAIYIPPSFQYGAGSKQPVILIPGTAVPAGTTYDHNIAKLLKGSSFGDPAWVNIPNYSLKDAQVNAEYVAYAINYIVGITQKNVAVVTFSQGSVNTQWALKYWPSTRTNVTDFVTISPDFHGTVIAYLLCPLLPLLGCTPSVYQQTWASNFISTLRSDGGSSAYVPTTTIYSETDEIVQPQSGGSAASGYLLDARGVGASNNPVQQICRGKAAGGIYLHEGVVYNPLAWALLEDALTHDGPGLPSRLTNLSAVCAQAVAPGLSAADVVATEATLVNAAVNVLAYSPKVFKEPSVAAYAAT